MDVNRTSMSQMPLEAYAGKPTTPSIFSAGALVCLSDFMDICKWNITLNQEVVLTTKQDAAFPTSNRRAQVRISAWLKSTEAEGCY